MSVSVSLTVSPSSPAAGAVVTAAYSVSGASSGPAQTLAFTGSAELAGTVYTDVTGSFTLPGIAPSETFAVPVCSGLTFAGTPDPAVFTATVPPAGTAPGAQAVSGSATVGGVSYPVSATVTLPAAAPAAAGTVPYPAALAAGHALLDQYLPEDLYAWRYMPGTTTPVTNGSGVTEDPDSPRNVTVTTDSGLDVIQLAVTSDSDCGVIQSPGLYTTSSGVVEALVKFSGFTSDGSDVFADWAAVWMYGNNWPADGEIDAVETSYGNSYVSYHYKATTSASSDVATTDPWTYTGKEVQLTPENSTTVPAAPNIVPGEWTYVTLAFGKASNGDYYVQVYYNGVLYTTVEGAFVTGDDMYITAGTGFGAPVLGSSQAPYDQPGNVEIQYIRVFS